MGEALQFERAEYEAEDEYEEGPFYCAACKAELVGHYFEVNGNDVCERCRHAITTPPGTPGRRFWAAAGWGSGAAVLGFLLYYGVYRLTGFEIGLISIAVGFGVGLGVRKGSRGIGGTGYQILAVALTYLSITTTYFALLVEYVTRDGAELGLLGYVVAFGIAMASPFLALPEGVIGLLIIGFGLWQAWTVNRKPVLDVKGPLPIDPPTADAN